MALHHPNQIRAGWGLKLVFRDFIDAVDQASTRGAVEEGLGIGRTEPEIGDDVGLRHPDGEALEQGRRADRLAMTGDERRTLRHKGLPTLKN